MGRESTVNAGDIARLGGVGRAAVSNWRRRHPDFPQPVGGTASSPLFSLDEIERWLRRNGKPYEVSVADRVWQRLRAEGGDLGLGHVVARAGALLVRLRDGRDDTAVPLLPGVDERADPDFVELLDELAARHGHAAAFEILHERYLEAHSRRLSTTPSDLTTLMAKLAGAQVGTALDPACGTGALLLAVGPARALGQDVNAYGALIAAARLRLRSVEATVVAGDSMRENGFRDVDADVVVCDPPVGDRTWGRTELTGDPRWAYGLPPRSEPELAWVQHCLAQVRPGGRVVIRMPAVAASRRPGRRIRANLVRGGALRAVLSVTQDFDLWLLQRPEPGERPPSRVLLRQCAGDPEDVWRDVEAGRGVRIVDLLDDEVDLSPARHVRRHGEADPGRGYAAALQQFRARTAVPPELRRLPERRPLPTATLGELAEAGLLRIRHAPARMSVDGGDLAVLTGDDLLRDGSPSGGTTPGDELIAIEPGDVVASPMGRARVVHTAAVLGPGLSSYRVDPEQLDAEFLAGVLRSVDPGTRGSRRLELRRTRVPRLPLDEQRTYGRAFRELLDLTDAVREAAEHCETLVRLGLTGLVDGWLGPE
ncbi:N-6 DNA methylase [Pseudonocardia bannensis]|uniref:N-6 DNA methylase n=1 Tax=Pseudonocardia bannensis TaxID=630973 RepID=A0A848DKF1_9PSEU|nr:N-6 DNA methylase [Pseudonocardia bannensis]NMH93178.1 N-6 DNA methylase [Pseudonocardia bannensis]